MKSADQVLINSIYNPPRQQEVKVELEDLYKSSAGLAVFSLARHALLQGLKSLGLKSGDRILVPSFICRDVLAPFRILGLEIVFYSLNAELIPNFPEGPWPEAKAILAVHYFGLETDLRPYEEFCTKYGAFLIEDNAHGFLSKSGRGLMLGTQGHIGIISLRKSMPIENGALLLMREKMQVQSPPIEESESLRLRLKNFMRPWVAGWGGARLLWATELKRKLRKLFKGESVPLSTDADEYQVPGSASPVPISKYIQTIDVSAEVSRRRNLFFQTKSLMAGLPVTFLRQGLGPHEVPYAFPFYCEKMNIELVKNHLRSKGLDFFPWPALPTDVLERTPPAFYHNLYLVKFLW